MASDCSDSVVMTDARQNLVRQPRRHISERQQRGLSPRLVWAGRGAREHLGAEALAVAEGAEHVGVRPIPCVLEPLVVLDWNQMRKTPADLVQEAPVGVEVEEGSGAALPRSVAS